ncbi:MAG: FtsX-like permease family protein [Bacilli bacterium]
MKSSLNKDTFREITKKFKIFLSILIMSLLGVGFYAGIKATSPDMKKTLSTYFENNNVMDLEIKTLTGFTSKQDIKNIKDIEYVFDSDAVGTLKDNNYILKILEFPKKINKLKLIKGRYPKKDNEIVIEQYRNIKIGDTIKIDSIYYKNKELKVVGFVESPLYISEEKGSTKLGNGSIDFYCYTLKDNINVNLSSSIYLTLDTKLNTFDKKYKKLVDKKISELKKINKDYIITSRTDNQGYSSFLDDSKRIDNIAKIFPIIFFLVATLISLTSMTRMVEEHRVQIGTLKGLGYTGLQISRKYIIYATLATVIGGIIGIILGVNWLPNLIFSLYEQMYKIPDLILGYNIDDSLTGLIIAFVCIVGATTLSCYRELKDKPAELMRPKSPPAGKRVLLEYVPFLWNRFNFTTKVTLRNMFRYKKRFFMTLIGIGGCTGLIFAGFGLKDSVSGLLPAQYDNIFLFDLQAMTAENFLEEDLKFALQDKNIKEAVLTNMQNGTIKTDKEKFTDFTITVVDKNIDKFIKIKKKTKKESIPLKDGIIITSKMAKLNNIKVGDYITLANANNKSAKVKVDDIAENYLRHFIYIKSSIYEKIFKEEVKFNTITANVKKESKIDKTSERLLDNPKFTRVTQTRTIENMMNDTMKSLNYVVWILIISAGILAFSVLYNLANVNINERNRELATIKVLGFYDSEVYEYIERESKILTFFGILLGFLIGNSLSIAIIKTCELDIFVFPTLVGFYCYLFSALITIVFTLVINVLIYFSLKKIDMIESLKSVE